MAVESCPTPCDRTVRPAFPETYEYRDYMAQFCKEHGLHFVTLTNDLGFHPRTWPSLQFQYRKPPPTIGSKAYPKTCTWNLKIVPIYRWLDQYIGRHYLGWKDYSWETGRKKAIKTFAERYGKVRVIIGIAKGEEKRVAKPSAGPIWMQRSVEKCYPMIKEGVDRRKAIEYIKSVGHQVPLPSNCMFCPFLGEAELLWLYRFYPDSYQEWVELEKAKRDYHRAEGVPEEKNHGVWAKKTLPEVLEIAKEKYGHWSDEELHAYKMTHGHCIDVAY
jgi:hypothetical protein